MPFVTVTRYSDPRVDYLDYANDLRGRLINGITEMEREIDDYIAKYFCHSKDKRVELMEVVIATKHLTFLAKAEIVKCLLVKSGDATTKEANKIFTNLSQKIAKQRNIIAHNTVEISGKIINDFKTDKLKTVYFLKYANTKVLEPFTKNDAKALLELAFSIKQYFWGLKYIPKKGK